MSAAAYQVDYPPHGAGPLRARPAGVRAALGMGVSATFILLSALLSGAPRDVGVAETQAASPAATRSALARPGKFSTKIAVENIVEASAFVAKPFSAFDIAAPEFEREKKTIAVRGGADGSGRIDSLTMGQFAAGAPFMRVDIHQDITEKETNADFFLDMARHAREVGLNVAKIGQPSALVTRFGAFETADIRLAQPAAEGVAASERSCLATRFIDGEQALEIAGLACGEAANPIDRVALGCIMERLNYTVSPDNAALNEFFAKAEAARGKGCVNVSRDDVTATIPAQKRGARPADGAQRAHAKPLRQKPMR